jgi:hypothetical protein
LDRRRAIALLAAFSGLLSPPVTRAQDRSKVWHIGFLGARSRGDIYYDAFLQGMGELGCVQGKNLHIEWRFAEEKLRSPAGARG